MSARTQQPLFWQPELPGLWEKGLPEAERGSSPSSSTEEACDPQRTRSGNRTSNSHLMEQVVLEANLFRACMRVRANKGSPGADGMTVTELRDWLDNHIHVLREDLLTGRYTPQPVKGVDLPKPGGGKRRLGIPTVIDRLVQQAVLQILEPILDPTMSDSSYGFRPGRSAHDALRAGSAFVEEGYDTVVDLDLEKFFDRVNHDILMSRLASRIGDKGLLRLIRRFLQAGMMWEGICVRREEGTPQGGPLSPLLANLLLDELDKELEKRGHRFCRYADDCNIYVRSLKAGERVMESVIRFLETRLKLRVNREKSAVAPVWERKFLGYRLFGDGGLGIAPKSLEKARNRVREITRRNRGRSLQAVVDELNTFIRGWVGYFRMAQARSPLQRLDEWLRRKIRCLKLKQCKRSIGIARFLMGCGIREDQAWMLAGSGKGWWRLSCTPQANRAMDMKWFRNLGLEGFTGRYEREKLA
jgi:RNA-directed DNA polymerase